MGIHHHNEKVIEQGYILDIFIPPRHAKDAKKKKADTSNESGDSKSQAAEDHRIQITVVPPVPGSMGTAIELDGPSHFESYMRNPLGPTIMKYRHLEALGYNVKSLPYWKYSVDDSVAQKRKVLKELLSS
jgi:RAP domain